MPCDVTLHRRLEQASGRLATIIGELTSAIRHLEHEGSVIDHDLLEQLTYECAEYGLAWMQETGDLLKELYNRGRGA